MTTMPDQRQAAGDVEPDEPVAGEVAGGHGTRRQKPSLRAPAAALRTTAPFSCAVTRSCCWNSTIC